MKILHLFTAISLTSFIGFGQSLNTGWVSPGTVTNDVSIGVLGFNLPTNLALSDDNHAYVAAAVANLITNAVVGTNYGFAIPLNAVIDGIEVRVEKSATVLLNDIWDNTVRLYRGGAPSGDNKANSIDRWPTVDTYSNYGNNSDLWGNTLTPSVVNAADFGVGISVHLGVLGLPIARMDHLQMRIFYTLPLPVGFGEIQARTDKNGVDLTWTTLTEFNNSHFDVQYSAKGDNWEKLGTVQGSGTSTSEKLYRFLDKGRNGGYYRLKQVDFDGSTGYSEVVYALPLAFSDLVDENSTTMLGWNQQMNQILFTSEEAIEDMTISNSLGRAEPFTLSQIDEHSWLVQLHRQDNLNLLYFSILKADGSKSLKKLCLIKN